MLTEKYRPKKLNEIIGQNIGNFKKFVLEKTPVILHGPTGTGKTSAVYCLANELGYELLEINASDFRGKNFVNSVVGSSLKQKSLFSSGKIVLVDDVDCYYAEDRGGIQELNDLIKDSAYPIVFTAIDAYGKKLSNLRRQCVLIEFSGLGREAVFNYLKEICKLEKIECAPEIIYEISEKCRGDLRAALNDIEMFAEKGSVFEREKKDDIFKALENVFIKGNVNAFENTDIELDECVLWLEENIFRQYARKQDIFKGFEALSKADVFNGRILRQQYWRFLAYRNLLMTLGIFAARSKDYIAIRYKKHSRILKMWIAKQKYLKRKAIAEKIAEKTHCSTARALMDFSLIKHLIKNEEVIKELELNEEEIGWIREQI